MHHAEARASLLKGENGFAYLTTLSEGQKPDFGMIIVTAPTREHRFCKHVCKLQEQSCRNFETGFGSHHFVEAKLTFFRK